MTPAGFTEYLSSLPSRVRTKVVSPTPLQSQASQDSQYSHQFLSEAESDLDYNYIPQEAITELLESSKMPQHVLEIVWNEAKQPKQQHNMLMPAPNHDWLN